MEGYGDDQTHYRILDCHQCFVAAGIMCHPANYQHNQEVINSSNEAMGVCCKPDSTKEECDTASGQTGQICSMKSWDRDKDSQFKHVLNPAMENYQMFAFCPNLKPRVCGMTDESNIDMVLKATNSEKTL